MAGPAFERFGKYILLSQLGEGGMGRVDRAVLAGPMGFHKEVAIKRIKTDSSSKKAGSSLINEARLGGQLKHPNIVEVYDLGEMEGGLFISMEFVNGLPLDKVLGACRAREMRMPLCIAFDLMAQLCSALSYAHTARDTSGKELRVVHRDLKPGNVIVSRTGIVKVMDFGIAKTTSNLFVTQTTGVAKGTPLYMSPEQIEGRKDLDHRSDIFALGTMFYELCTTERLFESEGGANMFWRVLMCQVEEQMAALDELLPGLGGVVHKCLVKEPADRWPDAASFDDALQALRPPEWETGPGLAEFVRVLIASSTGTDDITGSGETAEALLTRFASMSDRSGWPALARSLREELPEDEDPLLDGLQPVFNETDLETLVRKAEEPPPETEEIVDPIPPHRPSMRGLGLLFLGVALLAVLIVALLPDAGDVEIVSRLEPTPERVPEGTTTVAPEPTPEPVVIAPAPPPEPVTAAPEPTPPPGVITPRRDPGPAPEPEVEPTPEEPLTPEEPETAEEPKAPAPMVAVKLNTVPWSTLSVDGATRGRTPMIGELPVGTVVLCTEQGVGKMHRFVVDASMAGKTMCWDFHTEAACKR